MRRPWPRVLLRAGASAGVMVLLALSILATGPGAAANEWCGDDGSDWLCWEGGLVKSDGSVLNGSEPRRLQPRAKVWVAKNSRAKITFASDAFCTIGGVPIATEVITRYRRALFMQTSGATSCDSRGTHRVHFGAYCGVNRKCPVRFWASGKVLAEFASTDLEEGSSSLLFPVPPAFRGFAGAVRRELRVVVCSGSFRIEIDQIGGKGVKARRGEVPPLMVAYIRIFEERELGDRLFEYEYRAVTEACPEPTEAAE